MYNNSFKSSIGMAPNEALFDRKCRTPLCWIELSEMKVIDPNLIQETKKKGENDQRKIKGSRG